MISIIIPAHNEAEYLPTTLRSVLIAVQHVEPACEVIVVDDGSTDATAAIASQTGAKVVPVNLRHIAAVRNAGAAAAKGDLFVFLDADTRISTELLKAAWKCFQGGAVGGGCRVAFDTEIPFFGRVLLQTWNTLARVKRWAAGSFLFVRREAFNQIGGFDERFYAAEEVATSEKLKKLGPFTVLPLAVLTSARKMETHTMRDHLAVMLRSFLTQGKSLQTREGLGLWYETGRGKGIEKC